MSGHAEIVGIEEQLTVPSRHHADYVDVWIAISWSMAAPEWTPAFEELARKQHLELMPCGSLQVNALSERQGWIVARAIGSDRRRRGEVEALVRRLVDQANHAVRAPLADAVQPEPNGAWPDRIRARIASLSTVGAGIVASRRARDADIASST